MNAKFPRKSIVSAMLALTMFLTSLAVQGVYSAEDTKPATATKYYTSTFYASVFSSGDPDVAPMPGKRRAIIKNYSAETEGVLHDSAEVIYFDDKEGIKTICLEEDPEEPTYGAELIDISIPESIGPGEEFTVEVTLMNTGDANWYSEGSECSNHPYFNLGTDSDRDRESLFGGEKYAVDGWLAPNRVEMVEEVVYPEETGTFTFTSSTPWGSIWYKEYFKPVVEGVGWLEDVEIELDILVDNAVNEVDASIMNILEYTAASDDFEGDKRIEINLTEQEMYIMVGDTQVRMFQVSTGAYDTPTPTGTYYVLNRQELRVGGEWPHYHMPNWQGFTKYGHGLHSLPYLANDGGAFWYEALDHIGTPVSHGCIRMLPDDSALLYGFGFVGMEITIYY